MIDDKKIETVANEYSQDNCGYSYNINKLLAFKDGAKWMQEKFLKELWHPSSEEPKKGRVTFSRFVSKKAVVMCANRLEYILANNPDNFDLDTELSNLHETLRFAEVNFKVAGGIEEWNGNTAWVCANSFGMELMFASKPHKVDDSWRDNNGCCNCLELPKGTIKKLIGKELSFFDEPVELKEE